MKRIFLSFSIILLVNQIALAMEDNPREIPEITEDILTLENIEKIIDTDRIFDSEASYFKFLIDLAWRFGETQQNKPEKRKKKETQEEKEARIKKEDEGKENKKKKKELAFMSGIVRIRFYAIEASYREVMMKAAIQISERAYEYTKFMLDTNPPPLNNNCEKRYNNPSDNSTEVLWFDCKIKAGASTKHVKFWRGYKITFEIKFENDHLSILFWPEDPSGATVHLGWQLGWQNGDIIFPLSIGNLGGPVFTKSESKKYIKMLKDGSKFQIKWKSINNGNPS